MLTIRFLLTCQNSPVGIDVFSTRFLVNAGIFGSVLTLGRQALFGENADYAKLLGISVSRFEEIRAESQGLCEGLLRYLGARTVDSLDYSDYEGATLLHDLNEPVPLSWHQRFDVVIDGGSLEHVFNYPAALRNSMEMVKHGGKLLIITPSDNQCGHGFYQLSPELFFRAFSKENGYQVETALLRVGMSDSEPEIIRLNDPAIDGKRQEIRTTDQALLYITATRVEVNQIFQSWPQQSDYLATWAGSET